MDNEKKGSQSHFDLIVIGAGISGINTGFRVQTELPDCSYTILEARDSMGGTWDLFRYPGIRSDSDLHTFGFPWRPWTQENTIADGADIKKYICDTAAIHGIDRHIRYRHKLAAADWSSDQQAWFLEVDNDGGRKRMSANFLVFSTGYYDYNEPLSVTIPGLQNFKGTTIHPQFWPENLDYSGKKMIIVGSGATAITLLPNLAEKASHVTMLQRTPGYIMALPQKDPTGLWATRWLPIWIAYKLVRIKFLIIPFLWFKFCRRFPHAARRIIRKRTLRELPPDLPHDPHFEPPYNPWEQRLCVAPNGDFYRCLREGRSSVATGHIKSVHQDHIELQSGQRIDADIIITATGLKMQLAGGADLLVDGQQLNMNGKFMWKGMMLEDVPNAAFVLGYTNASWTLGSDTTAQHVCRLIKHMEEQQWTSATPKADRSDGKLQPFSPFNLNSTYVQRALHRLPMTGNLAPWKQRNGYLTDLYEAKYGDLGLGMHFTRVSTR